MSGGGPDPLQHLDVQALRELWALGLKVLERASWPLRRLYDKGAADATAVHPSDVIQGEHSDCFLMAAMAALAQQHPDPDRWLTDLIKDNGDGTYTVTFYDWHPPIWDGQTLVPAGYTPNPVRVDAALPDPARSDEPGEKWPAVIERAYGKAYPSAEGDEPFPRGTGGDPGRAMQLLTGMPSELLDIDTVSIETLADYQSKGYAITLSTYTDSTAGVDPLQVPNWNPAYQQGGLGRVNPDPAPLEDVKPNWYNTQLNQHHVYYVNKVDRAAGTVTIHNVWDSPRQDITMPYDQLTAFAGLQVNPVRSRERPH